MNGIKERFIIEAMEDDGDYIWALTAGECKYLLKIYKKNMRITVISRLLYQGDGSYIQIVVLHHKLYLIPKSADCLAIYEIQNDVWTYINIDIPDEKRCPSTYRPVLKFYFAEVYQNIIYMFPCTYPAVVTIDTLTQQVTYLYDVLDPLKKYVYGKYPLRATRVMREKENVVLSFPLYGLFYKWNFVSREFCFIKQFSEDYNCDVVAYDGNDYWIIPKIKTDLIERWNEKKGSEYIAINDIKMNYTDFPFYLWTLFKGKIWLFPGMADEVLSIDLVTNKVRIQKGLMNYKVEGKVWRYSCLCNCKDVLYVFDQVEQKLICTDGEFFKTFFIEASMRECTQCEINAVCKSNVKDLDRDSDFCGNYGEKIYRIMTEAGEITNVIR